MASDMTLGLLGRLRCPLVGPDLDEHWRIVRESIDVDRDPIDDDQAVRPKVDCGGDRDCREDQWASSSRRVVDRDPVDLDVLPAGCSGWAAVT